MVELELAGYNAAIYNRLYAETKPTNTAKYKFCASCKSFTTKVQVAIKLDTIQLFSKVQASILLPTNVQATTELDAIPLTTKVPAATYSWQQQEAPAIPQL